MIFPISGLAANQPSGGFGSQSPKTYSLRADPRFKTFVHSVLSGFVFTACAISARASDTQTMLSGVASMRLLTPLSSVSSVTGSAFRAVVTSPFGSEDQVFIPAGAIVNGTVLKRTSVGLGLIHERASLSLRFDFFQLPDGRRFSMQAKLAAIENARESVNEHGRVRGILAADSPQGVLSGVWMRPSIGSFSRSFVGLTGVAGGVWSHFALGPIGAVTLLAIRCSIFHMPDPEIQLPIGTELDAQITSVARSAPHVSNAATEDVPDSIADDLESQDYNLSKPDGRPARDIINLAFIGSRETLLAGFQGAGWIEAQPLNRRSKYHMLAAYIAQKGYSEAPTSELLYRGDAPDLILEKSLNDIMKRDHVRIWRTTLGGEVAWLGAATRDNGVGFDTRGLGFTHRIQSNIDLERQKVASDLVFSGCSDAAGFVDRPAILASLDSNLVTDGSVTVLRLHSCTALSDTAEIGAVAPTGNIVKRFARRLILEGRQYAERESAAYWGYRVVRWTYKGLVRPG